MSNTHLIIEERARDIGNFKVGRLLPFRKKRMVGPFIFIDHMGPTTLSKGNYMDVGQHPHIGISTLTYLLKGEVEHRDTTGARQIIRPGAVNWMTAGKGAVHTERTPEYLRNDESIEMHGYQVWIALPKDQEEIEPSFFHADPEQLPIWKNEGVEYKLIAGEAFGRKSPVPVHSPLFMVEICARETKEISLNHEIKGEIGICVMVGEIHVGQDVIQAGQMLVSNTLDECKFTIGKDSKVFLFGGEPFPEERYIFWNFVATSKERIEKSKKDWQDRKFSLIAGDSSYIPLPN